MSLNSYEQKIAEKREKYADLAARKRRESDSLARQSSEMASIIPMGQPILIGHHSERRDRNYRAKIGAKMGKAIETAETALHYERKAESYGRHGISSDDPEAVVKLKAEVAGLEAEQLRMKEQNKIFKKSGIAACDEEAKEAYLIIMRCQSYYGIPYPPYKLTNNSASIRRLNQRVKSLSELAQTEAPADIEINSIRLTWDKEENRICFFFPGKPAESVRSTLKSAGFKWSPTRGAWIRMANLNAWRMAERILNEIK